MFLLLALSACNPADSPVSAAPPPPTVVITTTPLVESWPAVTDVELMGVGAGVRVHLAGSWSRAFQSSCPAWFNGGCLNIIDPFLIGSAVTDARGHARIRWTPGPRENTLMNMQALVIPQAFASGVVGFMYQDLGDDRDNDGLTADDEMTRGIDPSLPDTDGGGIGDGQEVLIDLTNPRRHQDDIPGDRMCDGTDPDDDRLGICDDPDCLSVVACMEEMCRDGQDNDSDGRTDCADPDCSLESVCSERACNDRNDNDGDRKIDCLDEDCWTPACHTEVVAWVDAGEADFWLSGATPTLDQKLTGRVWVKSPGSPAQICSWYSVAPEGLATREMNAVVDPTCRLARDFLPSPATLVIDPAAGLRTATGSLFIGPLVGFQPGDTRVSVDKVTASEPFGTCAGGVAPTLMMVDADGDGYGVNDWSDLFGAPGGRVWVCDPNHPGVTRVGGDCHDGDASHNPGTVWLAAGTTCANLRFDDQDGDGALRNVDPNDHDARVQ